MTPVMEKMTNWFLSLPHSAAIGLRFVDTQDHWATLALDWHENVVGNPMTGNIHGGVLTSLVDTCSGLCVFTRLPEIEAVATLDLRLDHLALPRPNVPIFCRAECYRITNNIAFTRAICYQDDDTQPVAHAVGTFMRTQVPLTL